MWHTVATIGGDNGYYCMDWLWWLRGVIDWLVGGPGLSAGRRHPTELRLGDRIDYWTVLAVEPARRLTLNFGMRAPGSGVLELEVDPSRPAPPARTRLTDHRLLAPAGRVGPAVLVCAGAGAPVHLPRMTAAMLRRAEALGD